MVNVTKQDPWVKAHEELMVSDPGYAKYVKTHKKDVNRIVNRYVLRSPLKRIGLYMIIGGLLIGLAYLGYTYITSDKDIISHIIGERGIDQMIFAFVNAMGFSMVVPILLLLGIFFLWTGYKSDQNNKRLDFATRMVEGYKLGADPARMSRPKRY